MSYSVLDDQDTLDEMKAELEVMADEVINHEEPIGEYQDNKAIWLEANEEDWSRE